MIDDLEPEHRQLLESGVQDPIYYTVEFGDLGFVRNLLRSIANEPMIVIDNDHGVVVPGVEFVRLLSERPDWDRRGVRARS